MIRNSSTATKSVPFLNVNGRVPGAGLSSSTVGGGLERHGSSMNSSGTSPASSTSQKTHVFAHSKLIHLAHPRNVHNRWQRDRTHLLRLHRRCVAYRTNPPGILFVIGTSPPLCGEFGMKVACATFNTEPVTESIIDVFFKKRLILVYILEGANPRGEGQKPLLSVRPSSPIQKSGRNPKQEFSAVARTSGHRFVHSPYDVPLANG